MKTATKTEESVGFIGHLTCPCLMTTEDVCADLRVLVSCCLLVSNTRFIAAVIERHTHTPERRRRYWGRSGTESDHGEISLVLTQSHRREEEAEVQRLSKATSFVYGAAMERGIESYVSEPNVFREYCFLNSSSTDRLNNLARIWLPYINPKRVGMMAATRILRSFEVVVLHVLLKWFYSRFKSLLAPYNISKSLIKVPSRIKELSKCKEPSWVKCSSPWSSPSLFTLLSQIWSCVWSGTVLTRRV